MVPFVPRFVLYQRDDCHLCDLALAVLAEARLPTFESAFIDGDQALEARFGSRVPVLREDAGGAELDWPFEVSAVVALLVGRSPGSD
ncbi:MAG: glutaredoxin family protein [Lysobacter sp.]|nr:glutaredoxin family protein [Lysobacter sp.]